MEDDLRQAYDRLEGEKWRIGRLHGSVALRGYAAKNVATLLAAGHDPEMVKRFAIDVHGRWPTGDAVPTELLIARLSLWQQLHGSLIEDLAMAADEIRKVRIGAEEKSATLVRYARCLEPLSEGDANAVFNVAVDVAAELDHEIMAQIRLLSELADHGYESFGDRRCTARMLSNIVADAAVRLDGYDHFPWIEAMSALARLDAPLALANAARWDDETVATLHEALTPVLKTAAGERTIKPEQAAALAMFADDGGDVMAEILKGSGHARCRNLLSLVEEAANDLLIRNFYHGRREVLEYLEQHGPSGRWSEALLRQERFLKTLKWRATIKMRTQRQSR